ncbi:CORIN [Branchiostoma lanceolatum]|uniref:CORIN protein n=1 Tax=Branchiostoma lanceolatum TaxID=7740 RepID=A0A8K0ES07_BRALA|nr:CORIN [Branchiostoma lanceolatum]
MQIQLCRSVCEEMDARCSPVGLGLPFSCDVFPDRGDDPTCSLVEQPAECEPIRYSGCMGLSYSQTSFPNLLQWPSQDVALGAAPFVFPQFDQISDCHPDLNFFLCSVFFPQCTSEGQIPPCRSFCYEINATCGERALAVGAQWDASICPQLPEDNCSLPNADRATTPASTTQGPTTTTASRARASASTTQGQRTTAEQCTGFRCFVSRECISYVKFCNGVQDCADGTDEYPAVCSSNEPLGVCQPITPSAEFICTHLLPYENTSLPNYLNQTSQTASLPAALALNRASECHPSFTFLVCTTLFPKCEDDPQTPPCRELCDEVRASCEGPLQDIGEEWPRSCADLPSRDDAECLEPTSGACEPFPQAFQGLCEPLTGYNTVSFPNAFGHLSFQQMITSREYSLFGSILGNISAVCYPSAYTAFCRMFLPQCENGTQIQLCRSVCEEMDARCSPVGLGLPFSCDVFPDQDDDPTCSPVEPAAECEPIQYSGCMGLSYSQTSFPNIFQWPTQGLALQIVPTVFPTYDQISDCHPDLNFFLCSIFFPQCTSEGQIFPCRSFCHEINATCGERALAAGVEWDASICPRLSEDSCSLPNANDESTTRPPTTQPLTPPTPLPTEPSTTTTQMSTTQSSGCEYGGQMYPPGTTIYETPGCDGGGAACDENGEILNWDNFGYGCCEHNGEYFEDGTVLTEDGTTCICHGREGEPPVPMVCGETTTPPLSTKKTTTPRMIVCPSITPPDLDTVFDYRRMRDYILSTDLRNLRKYNLKLKQFRRALMELRDQDGVRVGELRDTEDLVIAPPRWVLQYRQDSEAPNTGLLLPEIRNFDPSRGLPDQLPTSFIEKNRGRAYYDTFLQNIDTYYRQMVENLDFSNLIDLNCPPPQNIVLDSRFSLIYMPTTICFLSNEMGGENRQTIDVSVFRDGWWVDLMISGD